MRVYPAADMRPPLDIFIEEKDHAQADGNKLAEHGELLFPFLNSPMERAIVVLLVRSIAVFAVPKNRSSSPAEA